MEENVEEHKDAGVAKEDTRNLEIVEERVVIRIKRKGDDLPVPSIYFKKANRGILRGEFFKHVETKELDDCEERLNSEGANFMYSFFTSKEDELNVNYEEVSALQKKRKHISLKNYNSDLEGAINTLKKYKVTKKNVKLVEVFGVKKKLKLIEVDLCNAEGNVVQREEEAEGMQHTMDGFKYDFYVLDEEKVSIEKYMDYLHDIKHETVSRDDVIVLDDVHGNTEREYIYDPFDSPSIYSGRSSLKEISDYPDELSTEEYDADDSSIEEDSENVTESSSESASETEDFYTHGNYDMHAQQDELSLLNPSDNDNVSFYHEINHHTHDYDVDEYYDDGYYDDSSYDDSSYDDVYYDDAYYDDANYDDTSHDDVYYEDNYYDEDEDEDEDEDDMYWDDFDYEDDILTGSEFEVDIPSTANVFNECLIMRRLHDFSRNF